MDYQQGLPGIALDNTNEVLKRVLSLKFCFITKVC